MSSPLNMTVFLKTLEHQSCTWPLLKKKAISLSSTNGSMANRAFIVLPFSFASQTRKRIQDPRLGHNSLDSAQSQRSSLVSCLQSERTCCESLRHASSDNSQLSIQLCDSFEFVRVCTKDVIKCNASYHHHTHQLSPSVFIYLPKLVASRISCR